jgi:hypothetical protein
MRQLQTTTRLRVKSLLTLIRSLGSEELLFVLLKLLFCNDALIRFLYAVTAVVSAAWVL